MLLKYKGNKADDKANVWEMTLKDIVAREIHIEAYKKHIVVRVATMCFFI